MRPVRTFALASLLVLASLVAACGDDNGAATTQPPPGLPVIDLRHERGTLRVEVASTAEARALGLGERDTLAEDAGMLFDLGEPRVPGFWMKGMRFPIDMVWIDEDKTIAGIAFDVQPQPGVPDAELRRYSPDVPVRYVLEVNAGASLALGLDVGERVEFSLP
jgi:uncharacterized membrane protein (UPF0127 family)